MLIPLAARRGLAKLNGGTGLFLPPRGGPMYSANQVSTFHSFYVHRVVRS